MPHRHQQQAQGAADTGTRRMLWVGAEQAKASVEPDLRGDWSIDMTTGNVLPEVAWNFCRALRPDRGWLAERVDETGRYSSALRPWPGDSERLDRGNATPWHDLANDAITWPIRASEHPAYYSSVGALSGSPSPQV